MPIRVWTRYSTPFSHEQFFQAMNRLSEIIRAVGDFEASVESEVRQARRDRKKAEALRRRWRELHRKVPLVETPTGLKLPRLALPQTEEPGEIAHFLSGEGLPGQFPFVNAAYPEMYLQAKGNDNGRAGAGEEPTRLFAGLGLAEDTNRRFHYLTGHQPTIRLSTAFDGPTLYGLDSD